MNFDKLFFGKIQELLSLRDNSVKALARLKIYTLRDLIFHLPLSYQVKRLSPNLSSLNEGEIIQTDLVIIHVSASKTPLKIIGENKSGQIKLVFFNKVAPFIHKLLYLKNKITISGKVQFFNGEWQISHPDFIFGSSSNLSAVEAIYPLTYGLTNKQLVNYVNKGLDLIKTNISNIDKEVEIKNSLMIIFKEICILHLYNFVDSPNKISFLWHEGRKKLAEIELLANQFLLKSYRNKRHQNIGHQFAKACELQNMVLNNLNFILTPSQQEAISEIEKDQSANLQMTRLLQGDVGCGKTLVALITMLNTINSGFQCALMAPTDLLANQHYEFMSRAILETGINIAILTGKTSAKERKKIACELEQGKVQLLIGTHALFQDKVAFKNLGYIVIDEQHKFGVEQRMKLINKSSYPDVLVMTATPIPRSLSLTMFGDMDVSVIKFKPKNRLPIITSIISIEKIANIIEAVTRKINHNEKIYWVCPLIEQKETETPQPPSPLKDVLTRFAILNDYFPNKVGLLHGKMGADEKENILDNFKYGGALNIIVATTVIEVGIDVPDATLIIIENAERFGLAQLHQLRGRVGRGNLSSCCILLYNPKQTSNIARERLNIMRRSDDGFYIAEQDMLLRGSGEVLGAKQSGQPEFYFADLTEDLNSLMEVNKIAEATKLTPAIEFQIKLFSKNNFNLIISG